MERFRLGMPKGSLNNPERADTLDVFRRAGYEVFGYESGQESDSQLTIANDKEIQPFLIRPQGSAIELGERMLDAVITGDDWIKEEAVNIKDSGVRKIGDLEYGQTRLVVAVPDTTDSNSLSGLFRKLKEREAPIRCFTEYINLTKQKFMQDEAYRGIYGDKSPLIRIRGIVIGTNERVKIINSDGLTEGTIKKGADVIVDNTQSGKSLRANHLKEIEEIMISSVGLYVGPTCVGWKEKKALEIFQQLYGAVLGKRFFDVKFNVPMGNVEKLRKYLIAEGLCADEPTIVLGEKTAQVNILIPKANYPETAKKLKEGYDVSAIIQEDVKQFVK
jgi:ATP phosphoribosyltransferase